MKIASFKDLRKLIKLCRETGVDAIEVDGVKFNMGAPPRKEAKPFEVEDPLAHAKIQVPDFPTINVATMSTSGAPGMSQEARAEIDKIVTDELTEEELLNWSVREEHTQ